MPAPPRGPVKRDPRCNMGKQQKPRQKKRWRKELGKQALLAQASGRHPVVRSAWWTRPSPCKCLPTSGPAYALSAACAIISQLAALHFGPALGVSMSCSYSLADRWGFPAISCAQCLNPPRALTARMLPAALWGRQSPAACLQAPWGLS